MIHPRQFSHWGHRLLHTHRLRHVWKPCAGFHHLLRAAEPGVPIVPTPLRPRRAARTPQGVGDLDQEPGEMGPGGPGDRLDGQEIFPAPRWCGIPHMALQLATPTSLVQQGRIRQRPIATESDHRRHRVGGQRGVPHHDPRESSGNVRLPARQRLDLRLAIVGHRSGWPRLRLTRVSIPLRPRRLTLPTSCIRPLSGAISGGIIPPW